MNIIVSPKLIDISVDGPNPVTGKGCLEGEKHKKVFQFLVIIQFWLWEVIFRVKHSQLFYLIYRDEGEVLWSGQDYNIADSYYMQYSTKCENRHFFANIVAKSFTSQLVKEWRQVRMYLYISFCFLLQYPIIHLFNFENVIISDD